MELVTLTNYRQVGGKLGAYIRANKATTQQIQGVIADFLAGDRLLPTMREVATMPAFAELQRLAGSGAGSVQRDSLLQELAVRYLPVVLEDVCQLVNGMLDLPVGHSVSSSTTALTTDTYATQSSRITRDDQTHTTRGVGKSRSKEVNRNVKTYPEVLGKNHREIGGASKAVMGIMAAALSAGLITIFNQPWSTMNVVATTSLPRTKSSDAQIPDSAAIKTEPLLPIDDGLEKVREAEATIGSAREHIRKYAIRGDDGRSCTPQDSRPFCGYQMTAAINTLSEAEAKLSTVRRESPAYLAAQDSLVRSKRLRDFLDEDDNWLNSNGHYWCGSGGCFLPDPGTDGRPSIP